MNVVHNANCIDALREYPDRYFDLIIASSPIRHISADQKSAGTMGARYQKLGCTGNILFHPNGASQQQRISEKFSGLRSIISFSEPITSPTHSLPQGGSYGTK